MDKNKQVGIWLLVGVAMLIVQVLLGGITRLTGSGLSITEWKPILGTLPPLSHEKWQAAFEMYQQKTGQFKYLNQDFTLSDFKFIYFWEWLHRNWARLISIVFLIPFFYFWYKKYFNAQIVSKLIALFLLGAAQGLIGWIMVKSGLNDDNLYVSHIRLAIHFVSALALISFTFWFALSLLVPKQEICFNPNIQKITITLIIILTVQLTYGAFMAGLKAATVAPTWPFINGDLLPSTLFDSSFIFNKINIHFVHRTLAFILFCLFIFWYLKVKNIHSYFMINKYKTIPLILVLIQILLGIFTVLASMQIARNGFGLFEYLAQAHQLIAMFLLMSLILMLFLFKAKKI